jgi:hypothetical protein
MTKQGLFRSIIGSVFLLGVASVASAQISVPVVLTMSRTADQGAVVVVRNLSEQVITAIAFSYAPIVPGHRAAGATIAGKIYDSTTELLAAKAIPPGTDITVPNFVKLEESPDYLREIGRAHV